MKVGDLVKHKHGTVVGYGIITSIDDSHRQTTMRVLFNSVIIGPIWEKHIEVISGNNSSS